jgi:hemoglobin
MGIFDEIDGGPGIRAAVAEFNRRIAADPELRPFVPKVDVAAAHATFMMRTDDFDAMVAHFVDALIDQGVPDATITAIGAMLGPLREDLVAAAGRSGQAGSWASR